MKKLFAILIVTLLTSCGGSNSSEPSEVIEQSAAESTKQNTEGLPTDFLGNYHGIQPSYFMKNQYGDDMVINGNKVPVPSIDYKFLLKENNIVSLQQTNLEDNSRVYYDGTFKISSNEDISLKIECSLSDGNNSNPTYILTINKSDKKGVCNGSKEPEFSIQKQNE
jgi:hypothetical protein